MDYYDKLLRFEFRKLDDGSWKENYSYAFLPFKKEFKRSYTANYINDRTCKYLQMPITYKALDELKAIEERTKSIKVISQFIKDKPGGFTYDEKTWLIDDLKDMDMYLILSDNLHFSMVSVNHEKATAELSIIMENIVKPMVYPMVINGKAVNCQSWLIANKYKDENIQLKSRWHISKDEIYGKILSDFLYICDSPFIDIMEPINTPN